MIIFAVKGEIWQKRLRDAIVFRVAAIFDVFRDFCSTFLWSLDYISTQTYNYIFYVSILNVEFHALSNHMLNIKIRYVWEEL